MNQMQPFLENIPGSEIDLVVLVLTASHIPHQVVKHGGIWEIFVREQDRDIAWQTICKYVDENKYFRQAAEPHSTPVSYSKTFMAVWVCLVLGCIHTYIEVNGLKEIAVDMFGASATRITHGEIYRATTALFLHNDYVHFTGNVLGIAVVGSFVWSLFGWGSGSLFILLSGILGNLVTACLYQSGHISIGASTSVFGALGILTGKSVADISSIRSNIFRKMLPLGSGFALLGLFSAGEHTDIVAHLFGFIFGIPMGFIYARMFDSALPYKYQFRLFSVTMVIILLAVFRSLHPFGAAP